jgi:hypothetical protein
MFSFLFSLFFIQGFPFLSFFLSSSSF